MSSIPRDSVDAGACADFGPCALSADHCVTVDSFGFMSARTVVQSHSGSCKGTRQTTKSPIGRCSSDGPCASVKELCDVPNLFQQPANECEVKQDTTKDERTKYGSCISSQFFSADENTCFWSRDDCDDKESFKIDDNCTCDMVRVGGCQKKNDPSDIHCAVSETACDSLQEFLTVGQLKALQVKDCFLCREAPATFAPDTKPPSPAPTAAPRESTPTSAPVPPPTSSPIASNPLPTTTNDNGETNKVSIEAGEIPFAGTQSNDGGNKTNTGAIVGGTVGALVVAGLLLAFVSRKLRKSKPKPVTSAEGDII